MRKKNKNNRSNFSNASFDDCNLQRRYDFEKIRLDKTQKSGAFKDKIFLISIEENKI